MRAWLPRQVRDAIGAVAVVFGTSVACRSEPPTVHNPPPPPPVCGVTSVSVVPSAFTLAEGESTDLTASALNTNCSSADLGTSWSVTPGSGSASVEASGERNATGRVTGGSPGNLTVTATVKGVQGQASGTVYRRPAIGVAPVTMSFTAQQGGPIPAKQQLTVTNTGGAGPNGLGLTGVGGGFVYVSGADWMEGTLAGTVAPLSGSIGPKTTALAPGSYVSKLVVNSPVAANTAEVTITYAVTAIPSTLAVTPANLAFAGLQGGGALPTSSAQVTVTAGSAVNDLSLGPIVYNPAGSPWVQSVTLDRSLTPATVTITPTANALALAPGVYTATVEVRSATALNSPRVLTATLTVTPPVVGTVEVLPATPFLGVGQTVQFTQISRTGSGTVVPGTTAGWSSSNPAIVSINATSGLATVLSAGSVTIFALVSSLDALGFPIVTFGETTVTSAPQLIKGVGHSVPTIASGGFLLYAYVVPVGTTSLTVSSGNGLGDADLYIFKPGMIPSAFDGSGMGPAFSNYTAISASSSNSESITWTTDLPGVWRIYVVAFPPNAVTGLFLIASHVP